MKFLFFLFFLVLFSSLVGAVSFSPASLTFNLVPGEESCQIITIGSESPTILISDQWAENKDIEWKISLFDASASSHGISINYPSEISNEEGSFEVCLSGENVGEYHGALVMEQEQEGNSIVKMGVWLKVVISEQTQESSPNGGSSSSTKTTEPKNVVELNQQELVVKEETTESEKEIAEEPQKGITGGVIGVLKSSGGKTILVVLFVLVIVGLFVHYRREKQ